MNAPPSGPTASSASVPPPDAASTAPDSVAPESAAPATPPVRRARRVGVMGGTFDPIHHGHLVAASEVAMLFELDEVVFVPTGQSWQKDNRLVSPPEDRYLMTVIATASNPRFSVSRVDIDRGGPTYTVDTLRDLRDERGAATEFFFITGADALEQIFSWRDADELIEMAHFVGCTRPGHPLADPGLPVGKASLVEIPALAISSTACRERVRRGEPVWYLVPDGIVQYINKRGLYRDPADAGTPLVGRPLVWAPALASEPAPPDPGRVDAAPVETGPPTPLPHDSAQEAP
jgi:nicotinate-nucleotide adenylyltransferase